MPTGLGGEIIWLCPSLDNAGNGTTTITDLSGNGNDGTLTNATPATAWKADTEHGGVRAIDLDGTNDYVATTLNAVPVSSHSFAIWVYKPSTNDSILLNQRVGGSAQFQLWLSPSTHSQKLQYWNGSSQVNSDTNCPQNQWVHCGATRSGTTLKFYINGTLAGTKSITVPSASSANVLLGYEGYGYAKGKWDDCRIFNRELTAGEMSALASVRAYQPGGTPKGPDYMTGVRRGLLSL
ncbi:LamG domain protein jellyroll fold domain protein [Rhodopirellula maiorica SM1]|uniref:LamG domain protein jellyroll fold domain protein n=1 Tax=Rhodopirellula maiorica SM1 TaxID=1265738 RepID=M5RSX0_9BACT|nr:LamG domain-containing protein [Rhodopirellula maiorica]EMI22438.1 LamG domain protein jellyroll fold domain protein [Rhodopirellula maiorica SM1]